MNSQNSKPSYIPMAIDNILKELEKIDNVLERLQYLENYLKKYKEELSMIKNWRPTLPQYMLILVEALEIMKDSIYRTSINGNGNGNDVDKMLVEEFLAWKRRIYENEQLKMSDLSSSSSSLSDQTYNGKRKEIDINPRERTLDSFSFKSQDHNNISRNIKLDSHDSVSENSKTPNNSELKGATRRTWTPELHGKFINAMKKIGGAKSASPKQIREIMNVEGLTNDQIKSHLQKYRLHKRVNPDRKNTVKINDTDDCPNQDQLHRRYLTPNLNTGLWDDQDDDCTNLQPQVPVKKNIGTGDVSASEIEKNLGGDDVSTSVVEKNLAGDDVSNSVVEENLGGDDVSSFGPNYGGLMAWMSHYFKATGNEF